MIRGYFYNGNFSSGSFISSHDILNIDLVKDFLHLIKKLDIEIVKIKAHQKPGSVVNYNIEVDKLSRKLVREAVR